MSYTKHILKDLNCNYLNAEENNAEKMLLSCINYQNNNTIKNNTISEGTINGGALIEGFTSDMSLSGGVSYVPEGECPVGFTKVGKECHQVCRQCKYTDNDGYFGKSYSQSNNICGPYGSFNGISDNGYIQCMLNN
tara:strand:+ start:134 stop:541 length:408 start_codon:yes stop_codon:yes gene_type:complete